MEKQNLPARRHPRLLVRYMAAIALVGFALFLTLSLQEYFKNVMLSPLFFCAVILTAWYGGFGPGILAGALSVAAIEWFLSYQVVALERGSNEI